MSNPGKYILTVNGGSSSLKFSLYDSRLLLLKLHGSITPISATASIFRITDTDKGQIQNDPVTCGNLSAAVKALLEWLKANEAHYELTATGHRVVLGGPHVQASEIVTDELLERLNNFSYLAPNHLPEEITAIGLFKAQYPDLTQVACYDTAFHRDMPPRAKYYPLPSKFKKEGLRRYGFHGLSYESILSHFSANELRDQNIIIAHLGSGSSMVAVKNGKSIDTTMGISPTGGMVMSTRSGDLDPGAVFFIMKRDHLTIDETDELLSKRSGLKAIAGTGNIQKLLRNEALDRHATAAIDLYCYQAKKNLGGLASGMGGLHKLIFTGGIGENSPPIRERICEGLEFLGISLYKVSNDHNERIISSIDSRVIVEVIPTNEELVIARHTNELIQKELKQLHHESAN